MSKFNGFCMTLIFIGLSVAKLNAQDGQCGTNLFWEFDIPTGALTITGTGDMDDFADYGTAPWFDYVNGNNPVLSLSLPDGLTSIGNNAFTYFEALEEVTIPNSVISIGNGAFVYCEALRQVTIPNSVVSIGNNAFQGCRGLRTLTLGNMLTTIGNSAFDNCQTLRGTVVIPNSVTSMGNGAFSGCQNLEKVILGDGLTAINDAAFSSCHSIDTVIFGNSLQSIGAYAFQKCYMEGALILPNTINFIGDYAFANISTITEVVLPDELTHLGKAAFDQCYSIESLTIGNSSYEQRLDIYEWAFSGCSGLTSITIHAEIPPALNDINALSGVPSDILVTVPCGKYVTYVNSSWNYFDCLKGIVSEICMISVDENNHNQVIWRKDTEVLGYNIYRESNINGQYELAETISYDDMNIWTDTESNARIRSYRYKIASIIHPDCREETPLSSLHKTMHLTINAGMDNSWNLIWTPYEGINFQTYNIYRISPKEITDSVGNPVTTMDYELIGTMPSGNTSFSDFSAPAGYVYYMVEIVLESPCEVYENQGTMVHLKSAVSDESSFASIRSNIATNAPQTAIREIALENINIYPNPVKDKLIIDYPECQINKVDIVDVSGKLVQQRNDSKDQINVSCLSPGIYFVKIETGKGIVTKKFIKE